MTEPDEDRPTFMPIAIAAAIVVVALGLMWGLRFFRSDEVPDDGLVGRAVVAQNDALQRENYADFRVNTCIAQQGTETQVLADQRASKSAKGNRFVDDVKDFAVAGDRATATVVYHFEKSADAKLSTPMTFVRENGDWKVCSPGPR
jgi:hypothetical protein